MLNRLIKLLVSVAREYYIADLMEDLGLGYKEAESVVKEIEKEDRLAESLQMAVKDCYQTLFKEHEEAS